jgi:DNA-binding beta-propeller fold protein YncE
VPMLAAMLLSTVALASAGPPPPTVLGPRETLNHSVSLTFKSPGAIAFRCSVDTLRLHRCAIQPTLTLATGAHVLRVQALGRKKHVSPVKVVRLVVDPAAPPIAARTIWEVHVNPNTAGIESGSFLSIATGRLYVPDGAGNRIVVYGFDGNVLSSFGSHGTGPGQFGFLPVPQEPPGISISGVAADPATGSLYVADPDNYRLQKLTSDGTFVSEWGKLGGGNGEFTRVIGVAVANGDVYALEDRPLQAGRVQVFDLNGTFLRTFGRGKIQDSGGIALDGTGDVLVSDDHANDILFFNPAGSLVRTFGEAGSIPGQLDFPEALVVVGSNVYVCDDRNGRIVRFDLATGRPTGYIAVPDPNGIAADNAGNLYVIDGQENLTKLAISG